MVLTGAERLPYPRADAFDVAQPGQPFGGVGVRGVGSVLMDQRRHLRRDARLSVWQAVIRQSRTSQPNSALSPSLPPSSSLHPSFSPSISCTLLVFRYTLFMTGALKKEKKKSFLLSVEALLLLVVSRLSLPVQY